MGRRLLLAVLATCAPSCALIFDTSTFSGADASSVPDCDGSRYRDLVLCASPTGYWRLGDIDAALAASEIDGGVTAQYTATKEGGVCMQGVDGAILTDPNTAVDFQNCRLQFVGDPFDFEGTSPFTIEAWVRWEGNTSTMLWIADRMLNVPGEGGLAGYGLSLRNATIVGVDRMTSDGGTVAAEFTLAKQAFAYVVGVYDGAQLMLYVDNMLVKTVADPRSLSGTANANFTIGAQPANFGTAGFLGTIDEVAVYPRALGAAEISAHYHAAGF